MTAVSADSVIALRAREDLVVRPHVYRRTRRWCVKDPISLAYFHLSDEEYLLLRLLDGMATLGALRDAIERRSPGLSLAADQLQAFLAGLHRNGLVTSTLPQSGSVVWKRREAVRWRAIWTALPKVLAIRFRGVDPTRLLRFLDAQFGWLYSHWCAALAGVLVVTAIVFVVTRFDDFRAALPATNDFFTTSNLVILFAVIGGMKVLHELAHGLTCRRFGGECHEMGVMLLVFAPCLYCDVSDSWMFDRKRHRIAVAAAGIVVEVILAAAATFGWWFSEPGLFQAVCMNVMLVGSMNTLLLNGNPLLRYDGYFVLSDLLEIPNLATEARAAVLRRLFGHSFDGRTPDGSESILITYQILSVAYRVVLTCTIAWMLLKALTAIGLEPLGYSIAVMCLIGLAAGPVTALRSAFASPSRTRAIVVTVAGLVLVVAAALVPLPRRIEAPAVLQPRGAHRVYATVGGRLVEARSPGQTIEKGELLGRLEDPALKRDLVELQGRRATLQARLQTLESRRLDDGTVAGQLKATREAVDGMNAQLAARERSFAGLRLAAPVAGIVLPPPDRPEITRSGELPEWSGSPLEPRNLGSRIEPGTQFCLVGDPRKVQASLYVSEDQVEAVRPGQSVRVLLHQSAGRPVAGTIEAISADPLHIVPQELVGAGLLPTRTDAEGIVRPLETTYEVRVRFDDGIDADSLRIRGVGRAKVTAGSSTIAERLRRFLRRTFRFEL